ncbi:MAG: hypothetical protein EB060_00435 [Proteobacteria bacterium]|nr:hypothetical protein [Pseudomonadota bacterium]
MATQTFVIHVEVALPFKIQLVSGSVEIEALEDIKVGSMVMEKGEKMQFPVSKFDGTQGAVQCETPIPAIMMRLIVETLTQANMG